MLQKHAYDEYRNPAGPAPILDFDAWCLHQQQTIPQFKYWSLTLEFILTILIFVRSLRTSDFGLYINSLTQLAPWLSALDYTNYARHLPVLCAIAIDHAHERNNAYIKGDGGAVGLTENPVHSADECWRVEKSPE